MSAEQSAQTSASAKAADDAQPDEASTSSGPIRRSQRLADDHKTGGGDESTTTTTVRSSAAGNRGGVARVLTKLNASVAAGNYYEAHQMYRTLYFRYLAQNRFEDCLTLLHTGAENFVQRRQYSIGADLGCLVIDTLAKREPPLEADDAVTKLWMSRLTNLVASIRPTVVERETLIAKLVKWSADVTKDPTGHPFVHERIARMFWHESNLQQARHHFLYSADGDGFARLLVELNVVSGLPSEMDLFILQVVLQQLCLKKPPTARQVFHTYGEMHPFIQRTEPPFCAPLLNFAYYLLQSLDRPHHPGVFRSLCDLYKKSLDRDPAFGQYLQKIGVIYFQLPAARQRTGGGLFGDLISQLFSGLDDDEEGDATVATTATTRAAASGRPAAAAMSVLDGDLD